MKSNGGAQRNHYSMFDVALLIQAHMAKMQRVKIYKMS